VATAEIMSESPVLPCKYDGPVVKQMLDDLVVELLLESYKEDNSVMVVTSGLGIASVLLACYGQFMVHFPAQKQLLAVLIVLNIIITIAIQVYSHFAGSVNLFKSRATKFRPNVIVVSSHMDRFSPSYSVTIASQSGKEAITKVSSEWIQQDGRVDKDRFRDDISKLIDALESKHREKKAQ